MNETTPLEFAFSFSASSHFDLGLLLAVASIVCLYCDLELVCHFDLVLLFYKK